jgi:hypothetical protein
MKRLVPFLLWCAFIPVRAAGQEPSETQKGYWERAKEAFDQLDRKRAMEEVQRLYQQAKAAGDKVPGDLLEWAREDLARAGRWEYKVLEQDGDPGDMESSLNEHGRERWECLSLTREKKKWVAVLKRPMGSRLQRYFGNLGATDILRLLGG